MGLKKKNSDMSCGIVELTKHEIMAYILLGLRERATALSTMIQECEK